MAAEKKAFDYVNDIWSIADYVRDVIRPADYNKLILPFAVLHLVAGALERTRDKVQHRKGKDEFVVIGGADDVADVVGYGPDVVDVVEGLLLGSHGGPFGWLSFQPLILRTLYLAMLCAV